MDTPISSTPEPTLPAIQASCEAGGTRIGVARPRGGGPWQMTVYATIAYTTVFLTNAELAALGDVIHAVLAQAAGDAGEAHALDAPS
jgi:hypothetical protein